jgi:CheY-like chemotaxis protein
VQGDLNRPLTTDRAVLQAYRSVDPAHPPLPARSGARREPAAPRRLRVLVAEDEELTQEIVVHILSQEGHLVDRAGNGQEALAAAIRGEYDLVLMDVNMPGLSGIEVARTIRSLPNRKAQVPIVAMTANAFHLYADEMRAAGMNGYLMKPISPSALIGCVRERLGRIHKATLRERDGLDQVLDVELLREEAKHFAPGAIGRFLDNLATSINEVLPLVQGWVSSDPVDIKRRLHNLAGVAGTLGCTRLSDAARLLETAPAVRDELLEQFVDAAQASLAAIRQHLA